MNNAYFALLALCFVAACKKPYTTSTGDCKTTYLGYSVPSDTGYLLPPSCVFGSINIDAGTSTAIATLRNTLNNNQGVFNPRDYCYYALQVANDTDQPVLYRISLEGLVTKFEGQREYKHFEGLVFRPLSRRLCVFERTPGTNDISLSELSLSGNKFSVAQIKKGLPYASRQSYIWSCVNKHSDEVFFTLTSGNSSRIYSIDTGQIPALIYESEHATLSGVRIHEQNSMLYCIETDSTAVRLISLTHNGERTVVASLPDSLIESSISTCLGKCNNEYVISGNSKGRYGYLLRVNLTNGATHKISTSNVLLGLVALD
jgi:hypothetical protein